MDMDIVDVTTLQKTPGVMDFLSLHFVGKWGIEWCVVCGFECIFLFFVLGGGGAYMVCRLQTV